MTAPIGFYVTCDDAECADCHNPESWQGFEGWDEPVAIFRDTEGDTPTHCIRCGELVPHALTSDGHDYVELALEQSPTNDREAEVLAAWRAEYTS